MSQIELFHSLWRIIIIIIINAQSAGAVEYTKCISVLDMTQNN